MIRFRIRPQGIEQINDQVRRGLKATAEAIVPLARANLAPYRDTGASADSLHVVDTHLDDEEPVAFVATASGDGFFIHEGTVDTPARPFLSQALDSIALQIPDKIRNAGAGGLPDLNRDYRSDFGTHRTSND